MCLCVMFSLSSESKNVKKYKYKFLQVEVIDRLISILSSRGQSNTILCVSMYRVLSVVMH